MMENGKQFQSEAETMKFTEGFDVLNVLVKYMSQSAEWMHIQQNDALITKADKTLDRQLEQVKDSSDTDCFMNLESAINAYNGAISDAAMLYGMRMAVKLFYAFGRPLEMSDYLQAVKSRRRG